MFYRRTEHEIVALVYQRGCPEKSWWRRGRFNDPARNGMVDPLDFNSLKLIEWIDSEDLISALQNLNFDYVCLGNGSGRAQQLAIQHFGRDKFLFSEYGWLPWSDNFYIARNGCGFDSDIAGMDALEISGQEIDKAGIEGFREKLSSGRGIRERDFIYVPLQKDVNDFKFNYCEFDSNVAFLRHVNNVVPSHYQILVKEHPLYRQHYDYAELGSGRMFDISDKSYSKTSLLENMAAMVCINSTSILEALAFDATVFAYGADIYCDKEIVHYRTPDRATFELLLAEKAGSDQSSRFVSLLLQRQINRQRCLDNDREYIDNHFWNNAIQ